jgi:hypothetical protein
VTERRAIARARTAIVVALVVAALVASAPPAPAAAVAGRGFDARYAGESVFTAVAAGESGQFSAIFFNAGTQPWAPGVVGLMVCLPDKTTCNVPSPNAAFASSWTSATAYATVATPVSPGQNGFFVYSFAVPAGTPASTETTFNGDVGLLATGELLHPEGYYQRNATPALSGPTAVGTFDLDTIAADGVSTATLTVTIVDQAGNRNPAFGITTISVSRPGTIAYCSITVVTGGTNGAVATGGASASAVGDVVRFTVSSTTMPGRCLLQIATSSGAVVGSTAVLTTRIVGPGTRLAVSSTTRAHPPSTSGSCTLAGVDARNNDDPSCTVITVDVLDVNGLRVTGDTRAVTATLDAATCAGGPRGDVVIHGAATSGAQTVSTAAVSGRATFVLSSTGPYPACRVSLTAPFLTGTSTLAVWSGF